MQERNRSLIITKWHYESCSDSGHLKNWLRESQQRSPRTSGAVLPYYFPRNGVILAKLYSYRDLSRLEIQLIDNDSSNQQMGILSPTTSVDIMMRHGHDPAHLNASPLLTSLKALHRPRKCNLCIVAHTLKVT